MNNRYRRGSTPILHVPTKEEWRKLYQYILGTAGGAASIALFVGLVIVAMNYRAYLTDKVLLATTGLSILSSCYCSQPRLICNNNSTNHITWEMGNSTT